MEDEDLLNGQYFPEGDDFNSSEDFEGDAKDADIVNLRAKLYQHLDTMDSDERRIFIKCLQYDAYNYILSCIKNMKKTDSETWKKAIFKLNSLKGIDVSKKDDNFSFNDFINKIVPSIGFLAGTLLGLKKVAINQSESSEPDSNPLSNEMDFISSEFESMKKKSVILGYCTEKKKGFSLNG